MIREIKRHYKDLDNICKEKNIILEWNHVKAHDRRRWNCLADDIAKDYARPEKTNSSKRTEHRNLRTPVPDTRNLFANRPNPRRHVTQPLEPTNIELPVVDPTTVPDNVTLEEFYYDTPLNCIAAEFDHEMYTETLAKGHYQNLLWYQLRSRRTQENG